mmetsp:Transcript_11503/g.23391  ORF Transcript_11503/g.23391 Transcript_11503/m.23391 type:complete len:229 (-) Transcript_11503:3369-4055(-)
MPAPSESNAGPSKVIRKPSKHQGTTLFFTLQPVRVPTSRLVLTHTFFFGLWRCIIQGGAHPHPSGDKVRDKVRSLLADSLFRKEESFAASEDDALSTAVAIEVALFRSVGGTTAAYKDKYRTLNFNCKDPKNSSLRGRILTGQLSPEALIKMDSAELANSEEQALKRQLSEKVMREAQRGQQEASTDQFRCGKCGKRECTYYQLQTRSADEPMTTFVTCVNCGNRWKC